MKKISQASVLKKDSRIIASSSSLSADKTKQEDSALLTASLSENNLGLVLIHPLLEYGARVDAAKTRIEISSDKAIANAKSVIRLTNGWGVKTTDYFFQLYKTSYISRLVHGLDYGMINETKMEDHQLYEYIQKMIKAMDIGKNSKLLRLSVSRERHTGFFFTFNINNGPAISMGIGYSTKKTTYQYEGKTIEHFERFGNYFSPMHTADGVAVLSPEISEAGLKEVADESHNLGRQVLFDFIAWGNPGELTEENYENFMYDKNIYSAEKKCDDILREKELWGEYYIGKMGARFLCIAERTLKTSLCRI